ncbi:LWamide neuropeptides-like isoform X2 [Montipora foliosa]|uniref:LWamide neuropeptides-like isoform X2 n=1 Tax=Montipora foliosa TaxID=591990 RepID=UPI0035F185EF
MPFLRMPAYQIAILLLVALLTSSFARHLEKTEEDETGELPSKVEREEKSSEPIINTENDHTFIKNEESNAKRQDDISVEWGRSLVFLSLPQTLDTSQDARRRGLESPDYRLKQGQKSDEPAKEGQFKPPGLWGRGLPYKNEEAKQEDEKKHRRLPGLWGREVMQSPLGFWGREIRQRPPGSLGKNRRPGLWGRSLGRKTPRNRERSLQKVQQNEDAQADLSDKE